MRHQTECIPCCLHPVLSASRAVCIPCCLRRVLYAAHLESDDEWLHRKILAEAMQELARTEDDVTPAELITESLAGRLARSL